MWLILKTLMSFLPLPPPAVHPVQQHAAVLHSSVQPGGGGHRFTVWTRIDVEGMTVQRTTNEHHPHTFQVSGKEMTLDLLAR